MDSSVATGIGAGATALGAAGSLFGNKRTPGLDVSGLLNNINQSADQQRRIANSLPGQLQPLNTQYQTGMTSAMGNATNSAQASATKFLSDLGKSQTLQGNELSDILKQRVLAAQPQLEKQMRESMAATGGIQRGATNVAAQNLTNTAMQDISQGNQAIALDQQHARDAALQQVYQMDNNYIQQQLGVDKDTLVQIYQSGRQDLIDQANQLLGISQNQEAALSGVMGTAASSNLASNLANQNRQQDFYNTLLQAGGYLMGGK